MAEDIAETNDIHKDSPQWYLGLSAFLNSKQPGSLLDQNGRNTRGLASNISTHINGITSIYYCAWFLHYKTQNYDTF